MIQFNNINNIKEIHYNGYDIMKVYDYQGKVWEKTPPTPPVYENEYLTIRQLDGGEGMIQFMPKSGCTVDLKYSLNGGAWTTYTQPISGLQESDVIKFKGHVVQQTDSSSLYGAYGTFAFMYRKFEVEGNVMSLLYEDNFSGQTDLMYPYIFYALLGSVNNGSLLNAENLILPATALTNNCYMSMFNGCGALQTVPQLPATTLAPNCYQNMFMRCSGLTTAPDLPATTLADWCYDSMFSYCTALTTAPVLSASTLAPLCFSNMFANCSSLNHIECHATDISANMCTINWLYGVAANGTFVTPSTTNWSSGSSGIPTSWVRQNL